MKMVVCIQWRVPALDSCPAPQRADNTAEKCKSKHETNLTPTLKTQFWSEGSRD